MNQDRKDYLNINKESLGFEEYDPVTALKDLESTEQQFRKIIPQLDNLQPLNNAFSAGLGAFIFRKKNTSDPWQTIINADAYDGVKDLDWIQRMTGAGQLNIEKNITMNKSVTSKIDVGYAIFKAQAGYTDSDLYNYTVKINLVPLKLNDTTFTVMHKMQTDPKYKQYLTTLIKCIKNTDYEVRFINRAWIIKDFTTEYKKYSKIEPGGEIKVGSIVDGSVA